MKRWLLLLSVGVLALPGCDVAVAAYVLSTQDRDSDDGSDPLPSPGFPEGPVSKAWIAQIPDTATADQERLNLIAVDGNPELSVSGVWRELGVFTATDVFDPDNPNIPPFNTILIQASSSLNYELDCVEVLDANNAVVEYASSPSWSNLVDFPDEIEGTPDGIPAVTNAAGTTRAFIFSRYTAVIDKFRINGHPPAAPSPGDILAVGGYQSFVDERPGGMAIDANGLVHLTMSVGDTIRLARYDLATSVTLPLDSVEVFNDLAPAGSHSVALNSAGMIFTAASIGAGTIQIRSFGTTLAPVNLVGFSSGLNNDRVEHNSIAVDGSGNIIVVGGMSSLTSGRNHWRVKISDVLTDPPIWQSSSALDVGNSSVTYWHAVATGANDEVFITGDRLTNLLSGTNQIYTSAFEPNPPGSAVWDQDFDEGAQPADVGHAIALDLAGRVYVGGSVGTLNGRNGALLRYGPGGASFVFDTFGLPGVDDEILDIAVDSDGTVYAVGYEGVAGQGENWWVRKLVFNSLNGEFDTAWSRSHHGGFGNDRAISVAIYGNRVVVAGFETNGSAQTKLVLRVYEK